MVDAGRDGQCDCECVRCDDSVDAMVSERAVSEFDGSDFGDSGVVTGKVLISAIANLFAGWLGTLDEAKQLSRGRS